MIEQLIFATDNANKVREVNQLLQDRIKVIPKNEIGCTEEIPETQATIEGNALQKARYLYDKYNVNCFAEDSGLEVDGLEGRPGVYSARYAGPERSDVANMRKVLTELEPIADRSAQFKTVIALIIDQKEYLFEGIVRGQLTTEPDGNGGFGYDPIFIADGMDQTFANISPDEKNKISHRGKAVRQLISFLSTG